MSSKTLRRHQSAPSTAATRATPSAVFRSFTRRASAPRCSAHKTEEASTPLLSTTTAAAGVAAALAPLLLNVQAAAASAGEFGLLEGRSAALVHPAAMFSMLAASCYAGYLGLQWRRTREVRRGEGDGRGSMQSMHACMRTQKRWQLRTCAGEGRWGLQGLVLGSGGRGVRTSRTATWLGLNWIQAVATAYAGRSPLWPAPIRACYSLTRRSPPTVFRLADSSAPLTPCPPRPVCLPQVGDEIRELRKSQPAAAADGTAAVLSPALVAKEAERKELLAGGFKDKHALMGSLILAAGTGIAIEGE